VTTDSALRFLDGRVTLHAGDCLAIVKTLPDNSIDACVTDPPYALVSIGKRFGAEGAAPCKAGATGVYARASAGFMGKRWDTGETAFAVEFWAEIFRVLKPGAHVVAFGGTRSYHRLACAIEDVGFEIRDQIKFDHESEGEANAFLASLDDEQRAQFVKLCERDDVGQLAWAYGSGFPKGHAVDLGIDDHLFGKWLDEVPSRRAAYRAEIAAARRLESRAEQQRAVDVVETRWRAEGGFAPIVIAEGAPIRRMIPGADQGRNGWEKRDGAIFTPQVTRAATPEGRAWDGWNSALKPAWEPICLERKPLSEATIAANVLRLGTGAINVDGCRVAMDSDDAAKINAAIYRNSPPSQSIGKFANEGSDKPMAAHDLGRWPANIVHDGSAEVVAAFPDNLSSGTGAVKRATGEGYQGNALGRESRAAGTPNVEYGDPGSAARFFYSAKADADDRLGSKHPTVKPVDLMRWLCRLVTPPGGTVLDPFAGTGTTGEAAWREGFSAVLIEREPEYQADVARRMALALAGPETRKREAAKARRGAASPDFGPLFGGTGHAGGADGFTGSLPTNTAGERPHHRPDRAQTVRAPE
jgi:site-specific DNA-methyltransferase (adenine-specific)